MPRDSLRTPAQTDRRPHLADETFGGEECAAEKTASRESIHASKKCATSSRALSSQRACEKILSVRRVRCALSTKHLNSRVFEATTKCLVTAARRVKKNINGKRAQAGIEVANVTLLLRYCHTCGFRARFFSLAFHFPAWLKGFCAVACPSQAKAFKTQSERSAIGRPLL